MNFDEFPLSVAWCGELAVCSASNIQNVPETEMNGENGIQLSGVGGQCTKVEE